MAHESTNSEIVNDADDRDIKLPIFEYFPDPIGNGCIEEKTATCACCGNLRSHMYTGPIYAADKDDDEVCPWCIADGSAAEKWDASFNDVYSAPGGVPADVIKTIDARTPGYSTWQGNIWLFSSNDALVFIGEVCGAELLEEGNEGKMLACRKALAEWGIKESDDFGLGDIAIGDQPAVYLFHNRKSGDYEAYADMT